MNNDSVKTIVQVSSKTPISTAITKISSHTCYTPRLGTETIYRLSFTYAEPFRMARSLTVCPFEVLTKMHLRVHNPTNVNKEERATAETFARKNPRQ